MSAAFRSFRERNVRIFFAGLALSGVGTWAQLTAVILLVRELGGGGLELGIVTACQFLPLLVLGLYAGAIADRSDRHRLTIVLQSLMGAQAIVLGITDLSGAASIPVIYGLTFVYGILTAFDNPARRTLATELVPAEDLTNVLSLSTSVMTGARMFGPALAAVLVSVVGTGWVFIANGVSYLFFLAAMFSMDTVRFHRIAPPPRSSSPIRDGLRAVWRDPVVRIVVVVFALVSTFAYNYLVALPLIVADRLVEDESMFGWMLSVMSIGNVFGSLTIARLYDVRAAYVMVSATMLAMGLAVVAVSTSTLLTFVALVPMGAASTAFVNASNLVMQQRTSAQMRSRVLALATVLFLGSTPIGGPITGLIGDGFGAVWATLYGAVITALAVLAGTLALRRAHLRRAGGAPVLAPT